jgi:hypothetical protein
MNRHDILAPAARRRRPRPASINIKFDQLIRHASPAVGVSPRHDRDNWAMEWLYEDFTLWAQIKLNTKALDQMMRENELLAQFNANTNKCKFTFGIETNPLNYLINLINKHQGKQGQ